MAEENIAGITIVGCNRGKTGPMLTTDYRLIASFYFTLSAAPPEEWIHIFEEVRRARRKQTQSPPLPTRVDESGIVIKCSPSDLLRHFDDLKTDVAEANSRYGAALTKIARDETLERNLAQEIEVALAKLSFPAD